jgi:hypothetical protein
MRPPRPYGMLLATTLVWAACAPAAGPPATPSPAVAPVASPAPSPVPSLSQGASPNADPQVSVDAALADAAVHLGVSKADLKVEQVEMHDWGDASLGCPRPGLLYAQIVTPGYLIVLSGGGRQLEYHSDARGRVVLCQER